MALTPQQIRAAELLSRGYTQQQVAESVGVNRKSIQRWLKQEDFKNLSYGLLGRTSASHPQAPQRPLERCKDSVRLTPHDLVQDALQAVQSILQDSDTRVSDRLKAASLIGEWAGLSQQKSKMVEMEAIKALIDAGWLPDQVLEALIDGCQALESKMKSAFAQTDKKALLQEPEEGLFDIDDEFEDHDND